MKNLFLFIFPFFALIGCVELQNPKEHEVPAGIELPIDGVWDMIVVNQDGNRINSESKFRFSKGRIIVEEVTGFFDKMALDKGYVYAKSIAKKSKNKYKGIYFITTSQGKLCECEINIEVKNNSLYCKTNGKDCDESVLFTELIFENPELDNPELFVSNHAKNYGFSDFSISSLSEIRMPAETQKQKVAQGSQVTIERSRTIRHQLNFSSSKSNFSSKTYRGRAGIPGIIKAEAQKSIRTELERILGRTVEEEETYKVTVTLDGNVSENWNLIWYDKLKTGTIKYSDENGNKKTIYFQFPLSSELEVQKLN